MCPATAARMDPHHQRGQGSRLDRACSRFPSPPTRTSASGKAAESRLGGLILRRCLVRGIEVRVRYLVATDSTAPSRWLGRASRMASFQLCSNPSRSRTRPLPGWLDPIRRVEWLLAGIPLRPDLELLVHGHTTRVLSRSEPELAIHQRDAILGLRAELQGGPRAKRQLRIA